MNPGGHALLLPFDTDAPEFARGFEAGRVWAELQEADEEIQTTVHTSNIEMLMRMAEALDRAVIGDDVGDVWSCVRVLPAGAVPGPSPGPGHPC